MVLQKLKILFCGHAFSDLKYEEIVGMFYKKELEKTNQKGCRAEKVIKRKGNKLYVKWKGHNNFLTVGLIKKTWYKIFCEYWVNILQNWNLQEEKWKLN